MVQKLPVAVEENFDSDFVQDPAEDDETTSDAGSNGPSFKLSEEGEAFFEVARRSYLEYKAKADKYGRPDTKWTVFPWLPLVVEATLPKDAVKEDEIAFRTQEMYMELMAPLVSCLEQAREEEFTLREAFL